MKRWLVSILVLFGCALLFSADAQVQRPSEVYFSEDTLKNDLKDLKNTIYDSHQNPFTYIDSVEFEKHYEEAFNSIKDNMSMSNFSATISKLLINLQDSHTGVDYGYLFSFLRHKSSLNLHFTTTLIGDSIIITKDYQQLIPAGSIILSINSITSKKLIKDIQAYEFQEGNSEYSRDFVLGSLFPRVYGMKYPIKLKNIIEYEFEGRIYRVDYPGIKFKTIIKDKKKAKKKVFDLEIYGESAVLTVGSFAKNSSSQYSKFLKKSFKKIKKNNCTRLAIDLRNNFGGSTWRMEELFSYLNGEELVIPSNMITTKSKLSSRKYEALSKGLRGKIRMNSKKKDEKMNIFRDLAKLPLGQTDTVYYTEPMEKSKYAFKGEKALFINHSSASASVIFAAGFRHYRYGEIYGTPCMGPLTGTWGDATPYRLKNTGLIVNISVIRLNATNDFSTDPTPIIPEYFYEPTLKDVIEEEDKLKLFFLNPEKVKLDLIEATNS